MLVGESFSGPLAVRLAAERPEGLRGLILVASFVTSPLTALPGTRRLLARALGRLRPPALAVRLLLAGRDAPPELVREIQDAIGAVDPAVIARRLDEVLRVDVRDALRWTACPLLYLAGEHDRLVGRRAWEEIFEIRRDLTLRRVDGPHLLLQRRPEVCAELIAEWLRSCPAP